MEHSKVREVLKFASVKVLGIAKAASRELKEDEGDVLCLQPKLLSTYDAYTQVGGSEYGCVYFLSSKELCELSYSTLTILGSARVVFTDSETSLDTIIRSLIEALKGQKNEQLSFTLNETFNKLKDPCFV